MARFPCYFKVLIFFPFGARRDQATEYLNFPVNGEKKAPRVEDWVSMESSLKKKKTPSGFKRVEKASSKEKGNYL